MKHTTAVLSAAFLFVLMAGSADAQVSPVRCDAAAVIESGWAAYRASEIEAAAARFDEALRRCPNDAGALNGAGYVALRQSRVDAARALFERVLATHARDVDALIGAGLVAWRQERLQDAATLFNRVREVEPDNATANEYLARLPGAVRTPPPARPPLVRPDTTVFPARAVNGIFEIRTASGWQPFHINGVNLGAALPGKHPSEFPDSMTYAAWIAQMADMGANTVRLYTIHPPHFYQALLEHNRAHPDAPLWVVHGVWAELPPHDDFSDPTWEREFFTEMERVVDLLHGRADIPFRPGHAGGYYTADVSQWVLAYIIGREWEPYAVVGYNRLKPADTTFSGRYLTVQHGTPMDVWLARACEHMIAHEMQRYNAQRPIAYTNWPTLDPLHHITESTVAEEVKIRSALGEHVQVSPLEYDNDAASLDALLVRPTAALPAGWFASYHAYPYYPDFMILDPAYNTASDDEGRSNYVGYLRALRDHHGSVPVVISEYGVPTSIGLAHVQPQGWHHGGLTEQQMADINARMTRQIAETGLAGGIIFAWIDEWFKKNWIAIEFEIPLDRNRLWFNRLDAEQHYGMIAMDAWQPVAGETLRERAANWRAREPHVTLDGGAALRVAHDEAYLWLQYDANGSTLPDTLWLGFDMVDPRSGESHWPASGAPAAGTGLEFALRVTDGAAEMRVQSTYNPFRMLQPEVTLPGAPTEPPLPDEPLPGMFTGRWQQRFNRPFLSSPAGTGWQQLLVVPNRRRFSRDSTEFAAIGYDRGILREGALPDGLWQRDAEAGIIEVRMPWAMLNVTDPSTRRVLLDRPAAGPDDEFGTTVVDDIGIAVAAVRGGSWSSTPSVFRYTWDTWEEPRWRARLRPTYHSMREAFSAAEQIARQRSR